MVNSVTKTGCWSPHLKEIWLPAMAATYFNYLNKSMEYLLPQRRIWWTCSSSRLTIWELTNTNWRKKEKKRKRIWFSWDECIFKDVFLISTPKATIQTLVFGVFTVGNNKTKLKIYLGYQNSTFLGGT